MLERIGSFIRKHKLIAASVGFATAGAIALGVGLGIGLNGPGSSAPFASSVPSADGTGDTTDPAAETATRHNLRADAPRSVASAVPQDEGYGAWVVQGEVKVENRGAAPGEWAPKVGASVSQSELASAPVGAVFKFKAAATPSGGGTAARTRTFIVTIIPAEESAYALPPDDRPVYGDAKFASETPAPVAGFEFQSFVLTDAQNAVVDPGKLPSWNGGTGLSGVWTYVQKGGSDTYRLKFTTTVAPRPIQWTDVDDLEVRTIPYGQSPAAGIALPSDVRPEAIDWANAQWSFTPTDGSAAYPDLAAFNAAKPNVYTAYTATVNVKPKESLNYALPKGAATLKYRFRIGLPASHLTQAGFYNRAATLSLQGTAEKDGFLPLGNSGWHLLEGMYKGGTPNRKSAVWNHRIGDRLTVDQVNAAPSGVVLELHLWASASNNGRFDMAYEMTVVDGIGSVQYGNPTPTATAEGKTWVPAGNQAGTVVKAATGNNRLDAYAEGKKFNLANRDVPAGTTFIARWENGGDLFTQYVNIEQVHFTGVGQITMNWPAGDLIVPTDGLLLSAVLAGQPARTGAEGVRLRVTNPGTYITTYRQVRTTNETENSPETINARYRDRKRVEATGVFTMESIRQKNFAATVVAINDNYVVDGNPAISFYWH